MQFPTETFGPWRTFGTLGRLLTGKRQYRARYICIGPALSQASWKFAEYEYRS